MDTIYTDTLEHDPIPDIGDMVFQSGNKEELPSQIVAAIYLAAEELLIPPREWKGFVWLPIFDSVIPGTNQHDTAFPGVLWLDAAVECIRGFVAQGWPTAIICQAGRCRSGLIHAAFWIRTAGMSVEESISFITDKRPQTSIKPHFVEGLHLYKRYLDEEKCPCDFRYENT